MKRYFLLSVLLLLAGILSATVHRVSNQPFTTAPFSNIQDAINSSAPGDSIFVEPFYFTGTAAVTDSLVGYPPAVVNQDVYIQGAGYFRDNVLPGANLLETSKVTRLTFDVDGAGSVVTGLDISKVYYNTGASSIQLVANRIGAIIIHGAQDIQISKNHIGGQYTNIPAIGNGMGLGCEFQNNIILGADFGEFCIQESDGAGASLYVNNTLVLGLVSLGVGANMDHCFFVNAILQDFLNANVTFCYFTSANPYTTFDGNGDTNPIGIIEDPSNFNEVNVDPNLEIDLGSPDDLAYQPLPGSSIEANPIDGQAVGAYTPDLSFTYRPGGFVGRPFVGQFNAPDDDSNSCYVPADFFAASPDDFPVTEAEFFVDNDLGYGNVGSFLTPTINIAGDAFYAYALTGFADGMHTIGIRFRDQAGNWSLTYERQVMKLPLEPEDDLVALRAFWDEDPGYFAEDTEVLVVEIPDGPTDFTNVEFADVFVDGTDFQAGLHQLSFRGVDENGVPGVTFTTNVLLYDAPSPELPIGQLSAFWDIDPGYGNEEFVFVASTGSFDEIFDEDLLFVNLTPGLHKLYWRSQDVNGNFSVTYGTAIFVEQSETEEPILGLEYFWDDDPGYGQGQFIDISIAGISQWETFISQLPPPVDGLAPGPHTVTVRVQDELGRWSVSSTRDIEVVADELIIIDVNGDGTVNTSDLLAVIANFGCYECYDLDFNYDGYTNTSDLLMIIANFGVSIADGTL